MKFIYGLHLMWYELDMLEEHLISLKGAAKHTNLLVEPVICVNLQTYIEQPIDQSLLAKFSTDVVSMCHKHQVSVTSLYEKTNEDAFYNIGDFRRDIYSRLDTPGYVVWGEIDALLPVTYFSILESLLKDDEFTHPHIVTFASRKMWDGTWTFVEHEALQPQEKSHTPSPLKHDDYITQEELNMFNAQYSPEIIKTPEIKLDGALVALRDGLPQHIADDMHFAREDFIAQEVFKLYNIPQYHLTTVLKGHNYQHPKKRINTMSQRTDDIYKRYEQESISAGIRFVQGLMK